MGKLVRRDKQLPVHETVVDRTRARLTSPDDGAKTHRAVTMRCQMSRSSRDSVSIADFARHPDEELVRLALAERDRDQQLALAAWEELIVRSLGRIRKLVQAFRFPGKSEVRIPRHSCNDLVQLSYLRARKMLKGHKNPSVAAFRSALNTCVRNACMDWCRAELNIDKHLAGSLDEVVKDDQGRERGRYDRETARGGGRWWTDDVDAALDARDWVARRLGTLKNMDQRKVLEMTFLEERDVPEIATELKTSIANVHQLRSRGLRELRRGGP
jgi:RNA polymerase sigma factor (sigma-70 family)